MGKLGITAANVKKKMNLLDELKLFQYGPGKAISEGDVDDIIEEWDDYVCARTPDRTRLRLSHMDGEILTLYARGTEPTFTVGLKPIDNLRLYKNYITRPWNDRNPDDELVENTDYTVNETTGVITVTLSRGDRLFAEYDHTAASGCTTLRRIALNLIAGELAKRLPFPDEQYERYKDWETQGYSDLKRLTEVGDGRLGIPMFDDLSLVIESHTAATPMTARDVDPFGGL